jgi:RNA polymerase sigma-70 factor, ECF subfamily
MRRSSGVYLCNFREIGYVKAIMASAIDLETLLGRVAAGDRAAFGTLYDLVSGRLFAVVRNILRRPDLAEEALQEAFVRVWQRAGQYKPGTAHPISWLSAIARNQAIDLRRRASERVMEEYNDEAEQGAVMPNADIALELKQLRDCLAKLPGDRQDMVLLAYYKGFSREELSAQFKKPVTTVKTLLRRSLATLKECLDGKR